MRRGLVAAALLLTLTGCSQISAIAPVGGDRIAEIRFAAGDILVAQEVDILTAPVCEMADDRAVTCTGDTVDGSTITVTSTATDQQNMTVTVGSDTIYSGAIQDALDTAVRPAP